jgi:hypothetical protein
MGKVGAYKSASGDVFYNATTGTLIPCTPHFYGIFCHVVGQNASING